MSATEHPPAGARGAEAPAGPPPNGTRPSRDELLLVAVVAVVLILLQLLRQPGIQSWNSIWQEDGGIFLTDALDKPFLETLVTPYNGYLHLIARLIAGVTVIFPLDDAALLLSLGSAITVTLIAIYVYYASRRVFETRWARALAGVVVVLLPATGYETNANVANLHWYLIYALFWVLIAPPVSTRGRWVAAVITAFAVLSDPLTIVLAPLVALMVIRDRSRPALVVPAVYAVTLAVQLGLGFFADPGERNAPSSLLELPGIYALRVTGSFLVGDLFLDDFWKPFGAAFAIVAALLVLGSLAFAWLRSEPRTRTFVVLALGLSFAYLAVPLMLRGTANFLDRELFNLNGSRYILLPILFLFVAFLAVLDDRAGAFRGERRRTVQAAFTVGFAALALVNFNIFAVRTAGPRWDEGLAGARQQCQTAGGRKPGSPPQRGSKPDRPLPVGDVRITVAPNIPDPPFAVTVDCSKLR